MRPFSQISQVCEKYQEYQVNPGFSHYLVIDLTTNLTMNSNLNLTINLLINKLLTLAIIER